MRKKAGYTQKTLADALNVTDKAVSKWERGICLPDVTLLPKLSLLLDVDIDLLVSRDIKDEKWSGLIETGGCDLSQIVYDKPLVYYLLSHYLLLGITRIYFSVSDENKAFLENEVFKTLGFDFCFDVPEEVKNVIVINHPWFLFGSDLTQQIEGSMLADKSVKLVPFNQKPVMYVLKDYHGKETSSVRKLGRGMVAVDMSSQSRILDAASFVKIYEENSGLLIASLEEIAYRRGVIDMSQLEEVCIPSYRERLKKLLSKPQVD